MGKHGDGQLFDVFDPSYRAGVVQEKPCNSPADTTLVGGNYSRADAPSSKPIVTRWDLVEFGDFCIDLALGRLVRFRDEEI